MDDDNTTNPMPPVPEDGVDLPDTGDDNSLPSHPDEGSMTGGEDDTAEEEQAADESEEEATPPLEAGENEEVS